MPAQIDAIGILSGEGELPVQLIQYCIDNDIPVCRVQFDGYHYADNLTLPTLKTRIEKVGSIFKFLHQNQVKNIVMVGHIKRPIITSLRPDFFGIKILCKIAGSFLKGDDNLLRALRSEIENEGFTVRGIDHYLTDLTSNKGVLTHKRLKRPLNEAVLEALRYGESDKGQSILYHCDDTYSYETIEGTTSLIEKKGKDGSILIKMVKPQQDPDLDRPTVGLDTLKALHHAGCQGMVIQANGVLMVNKDNMIKYANKHDLFIEVIDVNDT